MLIAALAYVGIHFLVYALLVRHQRWSRSEYGILLYHGVSFLLFAGCVAAGAALKYEPIPVAIGALSIHGIYSISFLELWSLSEGSYSFSVLHAVSRGPLLEAHLGELGNVGNTKRTSRLDSLSRMKLIRVLEGHVSLTLGGKLLARALQIIRILAGLKRAG